MQSLFGQAARAQELAIFDPLFFVWPITSFFPPWKHSYKMCVLFSFVNKVW